jgi:MFS family permease
MKLAGSGALPPWELLALIALIAGANLLTGFESSVIAGPLAAVAAEFRVTVNSEAYGFLTSAHPVGATVASLPFVAGALQDVFSRKMVLGWTCALYIAAVSITFTSSSYGAFVTGRFFSGVTSGIISSVVPVYLSEVAGAAYRGYVVSLAQVSIVAGVLFGFCSDYAFMGSRWRWAFTMFVPLAGVLAVLLILCAPFSPRWLVLQGRDDEARAVLRLLRVGGTANRPLFWLPFARRRTVPAPAAAAAAAAAGSTSSTPVTTAVAVAEGDAVVVKPTLAIIDAAADGAASATAVDPYAAVESELSDIKRMAAGIVLSYAAELVPLSPGGHAPGPNAVASKLPDAGSPAPSDDWVARSTAALPAFLRPSGASQARLRRLSSWPVLVALSTGFLLGAFQQCVGRGRAHSGRRV